MLRHAIVGFALAGMACLTACNSSSSTPPNNSTTLKDLHNPISASTASPPDKLASPLPAVAVSAPGGGSLGAQPDTVVVKAGDTLGAIAAAQGVSVADLMAANKITNAASLQIGQKLTIPRAGATPAAGGTPGPGGSTLSTPAPGPTVAVGTQFPATGGAPAGGGGGIGTAGPAAASATSAAGSAVASGPGKNYTIVTGDTACKLALANQISLQELADANGMTKDQMARLSLNQVIKIPPATGHTGC
jgi:LysM repeat protein